MSAVLTADRAAKAIALFLTSFKELGDSGVFKRNQWHVVISDPGIIPTNWERPQWQESGGILHEFSMGKPEEWPMRFDEIARTKCHMAWKNRKHTHLIQVDSPFLLIPGDTLYYGGVYEDGLAVGWSGVQPFFDEMNGRVVHAACRALCKQARGDMDNDANSGFIS